MQRYLLTQALGLTIIALCLSVPVVVLLHDTGWPGLVLGVMFPLATFWGWCVLKAWRTFWKEWHR